MSSPSPDAVRAEITENAIVVGNPVKTAAKLRGLASLPIYADANGNLAVANLPFSLPLAAGVADTSYSALTVIGSSTLTANDIMHQTLVDGAGVTTWTKTGFVKVTITDNAGNITSGDHYIQFGTLS